MANVTLTSKFVNVQSNGGFGFALYGYRNVGGVYGLFGTLSETVNGSSNDTTSNWYSSSTQIEEVYWADQSTDALYLSVAGNRSNGLWTSILIGTNSFTRSSATYSYNSSTNRTTWSWVTSTNPFGTTNNADVAVDIRLDVNTGHTGSIDTSNLTATETTTRVYTLGNTSATKYRIIKETGTTPSVADGGTVNSRTGSGTINIPTAGLPTAGNTATYQVQVGGPNSQTSDDEAWIDTFGQNNSFSISRDAADGSPNAFTFTDVTNAARSTTQTSNQITIAGINTSVAVSITGGTYSKNGGSYTSSAGTAVNGDTFTVRHTSSSSFSTDVNTTLNVGGTSDTYTSTTLAADTTPNAFTFTDVPNAARSTTQTSNQITIAGMNTSASVSITGGTYSKNGGSYTSSSGTAVNGDTFTVRHTSSSSFSTAVNTTLTVGGTSDTYTSTTLAEDTTPNAFTFTDVSGVAISTTQTSNTITVAGLNSSASVSITGGTYSKNGGSYTSSAGTAVNGDTFSVRHTSSSSYSTQVNTVLTIGGVSDTYTSTTQAAPTYSINAPASINEGSAGTINVTTTNVANSTTLYWDLDFDGDYSTSEGTVTITSNAGSFTITPSSDSSTEGAETDTIRLYSDSGRTTEVATDSFIINDTSTGSGGTTIGADGTDAFGINVYGPDGSTVVFSSNFRTVAVLSSESVSIAGGGGTKTYTGITDATDSSKIGVDLVSGFFTSIEDAFTISRSTADGGTITVTNNNSTARSVLITITRLG